MNRFPSCRMVSPETVSEVDAKTKLSTYTAIKSINDKAWRTYRHMSAVFLFITRSAQKMWQFLYSNDEVLA